jgi:lysophospholipase L1-like esterase
MRAFGRPLMLIILVLALAYGVAIGIGPYQRRLAQFKQNTATADVIMLGDSITEWGNWEEQYPDINLLNRGIAGDTSSGVLGRLDEVLVHRPRIVFLMIGVNDLTHRIPVTVVQENIAKIVGRLKATGASVAIESVLFVGRVAPASEYLNIEIARLNAFLRGICAEQSLTFVDLNQALSPEGYMQPRYTTDGTHLSGEGYRAWRDQIAAVPMPRRLPSGAREGGYAGAVGREPGHSVDN